MIEDSEQFKLINASFPHIGKQLKSFWASVELYAFVDDLLNDTREGKRKGFPLDILVSLQLLETEHDKEFPELARKIHRGDEWGL